MAIFITGDVHANFDKLQCSQFPEGEKLTKEDLLIITGDFGVLWKDEPTRREFNLLEWLESRPYSIAFICGNHENHFRLQKLKKIQKFGGIVGRISDSYPIWYLRRGEVYTIQDKKIFTMGGALSRDIIISGEVKWKKLLDLEFEESLLKNIPEAPIIKKYGNAIHPRYLHNGTYEKKVRHTIQNGRRLIILEKKKNNCFVIACRLLNQSWWKREIPTSNERKHGLENLEKHNNTVDYIISHTTSKAVLDEYARRKLKLKSFESLDGNKDPTEDYMGEIYNKVNFKKAFIGHMHDDWEWDRYHFLYNNIIEI